MPRVPPSVASVAGLAALALFAIPQAPDRPAERDPGRVDAPTNTMTADTKIFPPTHHGDWVGPNRLWITDPTQPFRSDGSLQCTADRVAYTWSYEGKEHHGSLQFHGQPAALRAEFQDSWHSQEAMSLHGNQRDGVVRLYGTYAAGPQQPEWGWVIELDVRDPEAFTLRMFNVVPEIGPVPAVVLAGARGSGR